MRGDRRQVPLPKHIFHSIVCIGALIAHREPDHCRVMGLPGKQKGIDGGDVDSRFREGKIKEIADYCEVDVIHTYQVWLRYELFRGNLSENEFEASQWTIWIS